MTPEPGSLWSVGDVATRLGLPASTLRTWERRYGLGPSARSAGGHRRYDAGDVTRLTLMGRLVGQGVAASEAAATVLRGKPTSAAAGAPAGRAGPETAVDLPTAALAAARAYDVGTLRHLFSDSLASHGVVESWTSHIVPTLRRIGEEWSAGDLGIEGEHLVSDCLHTALRGYVHASRVRVRAHAPVLLASAEDDQHSLPLLALQAAMADEGFACHVLGPRTPAVALAGMIAQLDPAAVFLWASIRRPERDPLTKVLEAASQSTRVVLGGPGWREVDGLDVARCRDLGDAVGHLRDAAAAGVG